jgi:hypothetical protein
MLQQCLAVLAHESETKEQLAFLTVKPVMYTIDVRVYLLTVYDLNFVMVITGITIVTDLSRGG